MSLKLFLIFSIFSKCIFAEVTDFIKYKSECQTTKIENGTTIELQGFHRILLQCWIIRFDVEAGLPYTKICNDDEVCRDLVCCPSKVFTLEVPDYDPVDRYIYPRLIASDPCKIPGTDISGIYKRKSECPENTIEHKVCRFDFCKNFVCCPIKKKVVPVYKAVEGKCLFETIEERLTETVGDSCELKFSTKTATCRPYFQCIAVKHLYNVDSCTFRNITTWKEVPICGYDDCGTPFVCCEDFDDNSENTFSYLSCKYHSYSDYPKLKITKLNENRIGECKSTKFDDSQKDKNIQYPYTADLGYTKDGLPDLQFKCQGVLISSRFVLSAAQCIELKDFGLVQLVRVHNEDFKVSDRITHPKYKSKYSYNDVGLIKLDRKVLLNNLFHAACLPEVRQLRGHQEFNIIGFNKNREITPQATIITAKENCSQVYDANKNGLLKFEIHEDLQICASLINNDDCSLGKIGAPIITYSPQYPLTQVIGINTIEIPCGLKKTTTVFTRIYPYTRWIEKYIYPEN